MEKFFKNIEKCLQKGSKCDDEGCIVWVGCTDKYGYGTKRQTWPDGKVTLERVHRLAYMVQYKLLRDQVAHSDDTGSLLDISHVCHKRTCVRPDHLILESHETNCERNHCRALGHYVATHLPACLFFRGEANVCAGLL